MGSQLNNVSSLAEHRYKRDSVHFNLALDNENYAKMALKKKEIAERMRYGYMKMWTEYHSK